MMIPGNTGTHRQARPDRRAQQTSANGLFSAVQFIRRVHTAGRKAPTAGCDQASAGTQVRVAYSADYYFYVASD